MTPKDRRIKLFKDRKPNIRPLTTNGEISPEDQKWLYAGYKEAGGTLTDPKEVMTEVLDRLGQYELAFFIEDRTKMYRNGYGVVGMILGMYNGWTFEPHIMWMPWANKMNKLRGVIAVLMFCRYSKEIGMSIIKSLEGDRDFFKRMKNYAPIYGNYKIPFGDPRGDQYIFYVRGRKK